MLRSLPTVLVFALVALISFTATAFAAGTVDPAGDGSALAEMARPIYDAVMHGQYWLAASLALVFVVALLGKYADKIPAWLGGKTIAKLAGSDPGRAVLVLLGSFGGAVATGLTAAGSSAMTWALAWTALKVAVGAAGVYSLAKKLLAPLVAKAPPWVQAVFRLVTWAFERSLKDPVKEAEAAGQAAVEAEPPTGAAGIVGKPRDVQ